MSCADRESVRGANWTVPERRTKRRQLPRQWRASNINLSGMLMGRGCDPLRLEKASGTGNLLKAAVTQCFAFPQLPHGRKEVLIATLLATMIIWTGRTSSILYSRAGRVALLHRQGKRSAAIDRLRRVALPVRDDRTGTEHPLLSPHPSTVASAATSIPDEPSWIQNVLWPFASRSKLFMATGRKRSGWVPDPASNDRTLGHPEAFLAAFPCRHVHRDDKSSHHESQKDKMGRCRRPPSAEYGWWPPRVRSGSDASETYILPSSPQRRHSAHKWRYYNRHGFKKLPHQFRLDPNCWRHPSASGSVKHPIRRYFRPVHPLFVTKYRPLLGPHETTKAAASLLHFLKNKLLGRALPSRPEGGCSGGPIPARREAIVGRFVVRPPR